MTSKAHYFKNVRRRINMQHGVLGFQTFKLMLCIYNKLRSHAEILS